MVNTVIILRLIEVINALLFPILSLRFFLVPGIKRIGVVALAY